MMDTKSAEVELNAISELQPVWLQQVVDSYEEDVECKNIISQLLLDKDSTKRVLIINLFKVY